MKKYTLILKSGARLKFKAESFTVTYSTEDGAVTGFKGQGVCGEIPRHVVPSEIAALVEKS